MIPLIIVSFIWAFSFGLIKGNLTGLDSNLVALIRMSLALLIFLPFLNLRGINRKLAIRLLFIGAIQYGIMYISYIYSYQYLKAYQVALLTIFTPLYVTLFDDIYCRRFHRIFFATAGLSVLGTGIIVFREWSFQGFQAGVLLVQISNISFAAGQIMYKRSMAGQSVLKDHQVFGYLYMGAVLTTFFATVFTVDFSGITITMKQGWTLLYLGLLPSGICFFLWNYGARRVNTGALSVLNNLKVPLAVACSMIFFHEKGNIVKLLAGGVFILGALVINEKLTRDNRNFINNKTS